MDDLNKKDLKELLEQVMQLKKTLKRGFVEPMNEINVQIDNMMKIQIEVIEKVKKLEEKVYGV